MSSAFRPSRKPLANFSIDWSEPTQTFGRLKFRWNRYVRVPPEHVRALFDWVHSSSSGEIRRLGERFVDLYYSKLDVGDDDSWFYVQALGRGGFGAVALFEKRGPVENILDQVAVKTAAVSQYEAVDRQRTDLSHEAALMSQTNDLQSDGMVAIRHFKHYRSDNQWKYYFEYCPYGDLERLRVRYKAYGRYFPEMFLWHLFYWLAKACHEYTDKNSWCDTSTDYWGQYVYDGFLLHCDIKLQNVFLGPPDPDKAPSEMSLYPIPRIADLGLAEIQSPQDPRNQAHRLEKGTHRWYAPELRWRRLDQEDEFYPFSSELLDDIEDQYRKGRHQITSKANLWAIGAIMYYMTSLQEDHVLSHRTNEILDQRRPYPSTHLGQSIVSDDDFRLIGDQYYSLELRGLIKACLQIRPEDRPDEHEVVDAAQHQYMTWFNGLRRQGFGLPMSLSIPEAVETVPAYKVYFRENEIDRAPDNYRFSHRGINDDWWTHRFLPDFPWLNPDWGKLWPDTMPTEGTVPLPEWPDALKFEFQRVKNQVRQQRNPAYARAARTNPTDAAGQQQLPLHRGVNVVPALLVPGNNSPHPANNAFFNAPAQDPLTPQAGGGGGGGGGGDGDGDGHDDTPQPPPAPGAEQADDHVLGAAGPVRTARGNARWTPYGRPAQ